MKYYFYPYGDGKGSLHRMDAERSPMILERWDGKKWVDSPETIDLMGFSSDADNYQPISRTKAEQLIRDGWAV